MGRQFLWPLRRGKKKAPNFRTKDPAGGGSRKVVEDRG